MQEGQVEHDVQVYVRENDCGLPPEHKDVLFTGPPGFVCVVLKVHPDFGSDYPTKGLAWGLFDAHGEFRAILNSKDQVEIVSIVYEPYMTKFFEENWCHNTES